MTTQLLFYKNVSPVSSEQHKDVSVKSGTDFSFAKKVNSAPIVAAEFAKAAEEFAIVFVGEGENTVPVVILGANKDENSFVDAKGAWLAGYTPAFIRRYPFVFSVTEDQKNYALCIDEDFEGCNTEGKGEKLFDAEGERTVYLEQVVSFQKNYQVQHQLTQGLCKRLEELDLLEPVTAGFNKAEGQVQKLSGFKAVNRSKLKALDSDVLAELVKNDGMELIYLHLQSLSNLNRLAKTLEAVA